MEENVVLNAINELSGNVNQIANNLNEVNSKVNELNGTVNELKDDFNEFKEYTNKRFDLLELGQKELRHEVKALRAKHEVLQIELKQELKDTKEELKEEIQKVDNRVAGLETFVGRYTNIVANKFDEVEKENTKDHEEFREALKIAN